MDATPSIVLACCLGLCISSNIELYYRLFVVLFTNLLNLIWCYYSYMKEKGREEGKREKKKKREKEK